MKRIILLFIGLAFFKPDAFCQTLIHYWDFNSSTANASTTPVISLVSGAGISAVAGGTSAIYLNRNVQSFTNENARGASDLGLNLRFNNPRGIMSFSFSFQPDIRKGIRLF